MGRLKIGDKVTFFGCTKDQVRLGGGKLVEGKTYTIKNIEVYDFHTDVYLYEVKGRYNSVWFDLDHEYYSKKRYEAK